MDLLPLPQNPTFPTPKTPLLCREIWDLGPFLTYLDRRHRDLGLTEPPPMPVPDQGKLLLPLQRVLESVAVDRLEPFVQTWLYFGLVAEFLALNELADGSCLVPVTEARTEMAALHQELCLDQTEDDEDGSRVGVGIGGARQQLLTGKPILSKRRLFAERLLGCPDIQARYLYLHACLVRAMLIVNNTGDRLRHSIRYSIAALGELFTTSLYAGTHMMATTATRPRVALPMFGFNWFRDYLSPGSDAEKDMMLHLGWCPSAIEKLRLLFQGIASLHYASRLRQLSARPPADHANCTAYACTAFQIDVARYRPRHARQGCLCASIQVDEAALLRILHDTESFPVLKIDTSIAEDTSLGAITMTMEAFEPGIPYVALSHVWADGLGNPVCNALPGCQLARVARSVARLQREQNGQEAAHRPAYRVWIDTICCPIQQQGKAIALERIANVYKNASHVLILDSSLTCLDTTTCHAAELLLKTFSCSPWMRRLWTLQEAILAKSLCIQFQDRAVSAQDLMRDLYIAGIQDMRFLRIWQDLLNEFTLLQSLDTAANSLRETFEHPQLVMLQRALHFRTVSVESDEPLCIATLMGLEIPGLTVMTDGQQRMVRVWSALAEQMGGIPSALVYYLEETLSVPGWRWAPKSLLGSLGRDSTLGMDDRSLRFAVPKPVVASAVGVPTSQGLRIQSTGAFLTVRPIRQHLSVRLWEDVTVKKRTEAHIAIWRASTNEWFHAAEWHRSRKLGLWTEEERRAYDGQHVSPLLDSICTNEAALVFKDFDPDAQVMVAMLGQASGSDEAGGDILRREHAVMFWRMRECEVRLLHKVRPIAERLADDEVTAALGRCGRETTASEREMCAAKAREWLEKAVAHEWELDGEFSRLVKEVLGDDMEASSAWPLVIVNCSNVITMKETVKDHVWFID